MKVLFVCAGNASRSQMAAAFYERLSNNKAISAGTDAEPGKPVSESTVECMREIGYDISERKRKQISPELVEKADQVVLMTTRSVPAYLKNSKVIKWRVRDTKGMDMDSRRAVRDKIKNLVENYIKIRK